MALLTVHESIDIQETDLNTLLASASAGGDTWAHDHRTKLIIVKSTAGAVKFRFVEITRSRFGYVGNWVMQIPGAGIIHTPIPDPARFTSPDGLCTIEWESESDIQLVPIRESLATIGSGPQADW